MSPRLTPGVVAEFVRIAIDLRGRFGGAYWRWRLDTATGKDREAKSEAERRRAAIEFARWRRGMRRMCVDR